VKTQDAQPGEDATLLLLLSLVESGQIKLRRIDGWRKIAGVLSQHVSVCGHDDRTGSMRGLPLTC
jgi:hypothetical protein